MLPINITEHNAAMWGLRQDEIDLVHGRSEYQRRREAFDEWRRERLMSGEVLGVVEIPLAERARKYIRMKAIVNDEGTELLKAIPSDGPLVVECDGQHYELVKNHGIGRNFELPVGVRKATVLQ